MSRSKQVMAALLAAAALGFSAGPAMAQVPGADVYLGVGLGTGDVTITEPDGAVDQFKEDHTAYKVLLGARFVSLLGVELEYVNFGKPLGEFGGEEVKGKLTGVAGFGLVYLPLPLPLLDVYAKAGFARLNKKITEFTPGDFSTKDTEFGGGAGVQLKFGSFAIRGEYEVFKTDGKDPNLLSISFVKSFL